MSYKKRKNYTKRKTPTAKKGKGSKGLFSKGSKNLKKADKYNALYRKSNYVYGYTRKYKRTKKLQSSFILASCMIIGFIILMLRCY